jgi:hypothetical protein
MGVKHDGNPFPIDGHCCKTSLSMMRCLLPDKIDQTSGNKKLLKPSRIREKGRDGAAI